MTTISALDHFKGKDTLDLVSSFATLNRNGLHIGDRDAPAADPGEFAEAPGFTTTAESEAFYKRAKAHAARCGLDIATAAARVDDPQLKAMDEWRAAVKAYAAEHKCSEAEARILVPHPLA